MKPVSMKKTNQTGRHLTSIHQNRRGSTLLVVIALLAMLSLLGVVFYTFASQEERSAQYFTEASLNEADPGLDADVLFNWGLQQLIVGPDDSLYNSALHGKRHSLLTNMFGSDIHPFNGQGINVILNASGLVVIDQNHTGDATIGSGNTDFLHLNHSRAAHGGPLPTSLANFPEPDVDYTSPDINNLFLAFDGYTLQGTTVRRVIIPSFVRPQFLRPNTADWYQNTNTATKVLRPHPNHIFINPDGTASGTNRFTGSFPFQPTANAGGDASKNGELGIFTESFNVGTPILELDVDNDNDGITEGIWMDLDFPPIEDPNNPGSYIIPLFSFTVKDLDALINLNTAGNMRRPTDIDLNYDPTNNFFGEHSSIYTDKYLYLSRSNMGLSSPGEINPQWALNARPATGSGGDLQGSAVAADVFQQHRLFFGDYPYPHGSIAAPRAYAGAGDFQTAYELSRDWREISNMEYFFLCHGRPEFSIPSPIAKGTKTEITDLYPGRWGESNRLYDAQRVSSGDNIFVVNTGVSPNIAFPRPGQTLIDDNGNRYEGGTLSGSLNGTRADVHAFLHPLAYNGSGRSNKTGANSNKAMISQNGWRAYEDIEVAGSIRYNGGLTFFKNSSANVSANLGTLVDEPDEMTVDLEKVQRPYDEPFTADDLAFLHMAQTDQDNTGVNSRLENLAPFNFGRAATVNIRGDAIRRQFTTMSWGRKHFGMSIIPGLRDWETSGGFPPFGALATNVDPFRPALRALLTVNPGNTTTPQLQMKLNLNELLVFDQTGTGRTVTTRPLTPHPGEDVNDNATLDAGEDLNGNGVLDTLAAAAINSSWDGFNLPAYPPNSTAVQEFWARYDRQLMARDLFVLLYTLGGGSDAINYSTNTTPYTGTTQLKEMAQFAVNVVDALDPDDVITRFEYDTNLSNGWNLDDNPYSTGDSDRAEVFGVEAQKLTLSEFIALKALKVTNAGTDEDHGATEYNDEEDRYFSFLELRNAGHQTVSFANDAWQIRLEPRADGVNADYADLDNLPTDSRIPNDSDKRRVTLRSGSVGAAGIFSIRSAGDADNVDSMTSMPRPSYFRVDPDYTGSGTATFSTIIPQDTSTAALDLITDDDTTEFFMTSEADTVTAISNRGDFLNDSNTDAGTTDFDDLTFVVRLMRRAHLGRGAPAFNSAVDNADNPWVEVDSMVVSGMHEFELTPGDVTTAIQGKLYPLESYEREQPLYARGTGSTTHASGSGTNYRANSVGATNSNTTAGTVGADGFNGIATVDDDLQNGADDSGERGWAFSDDTPRFDIWQPHFDRDFASIIELLSVPIVGPNRITRDLATESGWQTRTDTTTTVDRANDVKFAGIQKFLDPNGPDDTVSITADDNRWYRLLEFVEVPTRMHQQLGNPLNDPRVPGRINLNTLRHPSILAALLDDTDTFYMNLTISSRPSLNATHLSGTEWWGEFINSRDNADGGITDAPRIPGTPGSRPFRSFHHGKGFSTATNVQDLREHTILRTLPVDVTGGSNNPRLLFEVAFPTEHLGTAGAADKVDFHTRNRLLSKIAGNTTTRSNTFVVFMSVAYFEASGAGTTTYGSPVVIGARANSLSPNAPDYRGFFVIDRTRAEEAFEPSTGQFDNWKRLIRYRHQIE